MKYKNYAPMEDGDMLNIEIDGEILKPEWYLHGYCDSFVIALAEYMQTQKIPFNILVVTDEHGLIHCGIVIDSNETDEYYFVDVRGITSDEDEFFDEFEDFLMYNDWLCDGYFFKDINKAKKFIYNVIQPTETCEEYYAGDIMDKAKKILTAYKEYYTFPDKLKKYIKNDEG